MIDLNYNCLFMEKNNLIKLLIFHNTLAEYRVGFFNELNKICDLMIVFTDYNLAERVYNNKIDKAEINFKYKILIGNKKSKIKNCLEIIETHNPDWIIIPALDDLFSVSLARKLMKYCHSRDIKVGLFWEKWCWKYNKMPLSRLFKELMQRFLVSSIIKQCDALITPGRKSAEYLISCGGNINKIYKVHDASEIKQTNFENIYRKYNIDESKKLILFLGRIVFYKGLDNLIHAIASLTEEYKNSHVLLVCGDGPDRANCEKLKKIYRLNNVIFTGAVPPIERASYYEQSSVFVLPGRANKGKIEAWGLSLNEAMQFNNILISTTSVGAAYELINENNGFIIEENSIQELASALLSADQNEMKEKAKVENKKLFMLYNYKNMAKDIIDILNGNGSCIL